MDITVPALLRNDADIADIRPAAVFRGHADAYDLSIVERSHLPPLRLPAFLIALLIVKVSSGRLQRSHLTDLLLCIMVQRAFSDTRHRFDECGVADLGERAKHQPCRERRNGIFLRPLEFT